MGAVDKGNPSFLGSGAIGGVGTALGVNSSSLRLLFHMGDGPYLVYIGYREMANGDFWEGSLHARRLGRGGVWKPCHIFEQR